MAMPTIYANTQRDGTIFASLLLFTGKSVDLGRHSAINHNPATIVANPKKACKPNSTACKGELVSIGL